MARRFTDARELLRDLLNRHEAGTTKPIAHPDYAAFPSVVKADAFAKELALAEESGAVAIARGRGAREGEILHVRLKAPHVLYELLQRTPITRIADDASSRLIEGLSLHTGLLEAVSDIAATWSRARAWSGYGPEDVVRLRSALSLAQAVLDGRHMGVDYRTFSRRVAGDSKALEKAEGAVVRLLSGVLDLPSGARPRDALRTLGLERFAPPLLIAAQMDLKGADLSKTSLAYLGLPPNETRWILFRSKPLYVLTIENFASFNRHITEADPSRLGATIYVGGYPSLATQDALRQIAEMLPDDVPFFHWSDIDPDGTWIFRTIERAVRRPLQAHLMSVEIAEEHGRPQMTRTVPRPCSDDSEIAPLVRYFSRPDAKTLEQEELDPRLPPFGIK